MIQWAIRLVFIGPVLAGLIGLVVPALGYAPVLGGDTISLAPLRAVFDWPGIWRASWLSIQVGFLATLISLVIVVGFMAAFHHSRAMRWARSALAPILAMPHAAAAFGVAYMIAPSGWISRAISPGLTGWDRPPDVLILNDPGGLALIAGLVVKEVPFLLMMAIAASAQVRVAQSSQIAQSLGYAPATAWIKTVFPLIYRQIKMPIYVVLAFSMTVVDAALVLGPTTPSTLSVQILRWMNAPDLSLRMVAAAAGIWQALLVLGAIGLWRLAERGIAGVGKAWLAQSGRQQMSRIAALVGGAGMTAGFLLILGSIFVLLLWSFAGSWSYPNAIPDTLSLRQWARQSDGLTNALGNTFWVGLTAWMIAMITAVVTLHFGRRSLGPLIYLPLLVPQIVFLPGLQLLLLQSGWNKGFTPVIAAHLMIVLPYVLLSLSDPWRALDPGYEQSAASLGASPIRSLFAVRLPMLTRPLLTASALAFAVSLGQYLPTLLMSGGRISTITTEAVAMASGGNRRVLAVWASVQTLSAILPFMAALLLPNLIFRNRKGML